MVENNLNFVDNQKLGGNELSTIYTANGHVSFQVFD